jgi:hypothetical protein
MRAATILLLATACGGMKDPASVADNFVDKYYVESDQDRALPFTTGIATMRLHEELKLVADARGGNSGGLQVRPERVYYKRKDGLTQGDKRAFEYELDIRPQGGGELQRLAHVDLEKQPDGSWRVGNFSETQPR